MRKIIIIALLFTGFHSFSQDSYDYWVLERRTPNWALQAFNEVNKQQTYELSDFVNPFYFEEDFNGDGKLDVALLIKNIKTTETGILIIHGSTKDHFIFGAGTNTEDWPNTYSWMDVWKIFRGSKTHELTYLDNGDIDGSIEISIAYPSLEIIKTEAASGLLYWNGNEYKWAQQSD